MRYKNLRGPRTVERTREMVSRRSPWDGWIVRRKRVPCPLDEDLLLGAVWAAAQQELSAWHFVLDSSTVLLFSPVVLLKANCSVFDLLFDSFALRRSTFDHCRSLEIRTLLL